MTNETAGLPPAMDDEPPAKFRGVEPVLEPAIGAAEGEIVLGEERSVADPPGEGTRSYAAKLLTSFIERCERLDHERAELVADRREVLKEAKHAGFDPVVINMVIRRRKLEPEVREAQDATLAVYEEAVGMGGYGARPIEAARDAAALAAPAAPKPAKAKKPTAKDLAVAEAVGWAGSGARH